MAIRVKQLALRKQSSHQKIYTYTKWNGTFIAAFGGTISSQRKGLVRLNQKSRAGHQCSNYLIFYSNIFLWLHTPQWESQELELEIEKKEFHFSPKITVWIHKFLDLKLSEPGRWSSNKDINAFNHQGSTKCLTIPFSNQVLKKEMWKKY